MKRTALIVIDLQNEYVPTGKLPISGLDPAVANAVADRGHTVTVLHDACATLDLAFGGVIVPAAQVHAAAMAPLEFGSAAVRVTRDWLGGA